MEDKKDSEEFAKKIAKEASNIIVNQVKDELEKDFIKRKEENDKYFWS